MALPRLITPRLTLRAPVPADAGPLSELSSDIDVARMLTRVRFPNPPHAVAAWIEGVEAGAEDAWVIEDAAGAPLGTVGLVSGRLGYWLARAAWGRGVATEAARAVLVHGFGAGRLDEIRASAFDDNPASRSVLRKLGFEAVERSRALCISRRAEVAQTGFVLSRAGWAAAQAPLAIRTARALIDPLRPGDAPALAALGGDPRVARMMSTLPIGFDAAAAAARISARAWRGRPGFSAALRVDGRLAGEISLGPSPRPEFAIWLGRDWQGRGLGREAGSAFLSAMMRRFGLARVEAEAFADNAASRALLARLGFEETGRLSGASLARDGEHPAVRLALTSTPQGHRTAP